jgi:hypothetical protein
VDGALGRDDDARAAGRIEDLADGHRRGSADEAMTRADAAVERGDAAVERAADKLRDLAGRAAADGGLKAKLAQPLAEDAEFLRKLKPSLIVARARGEAPTDQEPGAVTVVPGGPQLGPRPTPPGATARNPWMVVGIAFAAGVILAKAIDWRSHAHPR